MAKRACDNAADKIAIADCINIDCLENATFIMDALAAQRDVRCKNPVFHCVLSWKEGEIPTEQQAKEAAVITLKELGLENCPAVYGVHKDTHNYHLQMSVCRIDPDTLKAVDAGGGFTKKAMERAARRVEYEQGWGIEQNAWTGIDAEGNTVEKPKFLDKPLPQKTADMENLTGEKSAMRKANEILGKKYESLSNWQEFHKMVRDNGMEYNKKGSGAILTIGDITVKASNVSRNLSLTKLENIYGPYEEPASDIALNKKEEHKNNNPQPISEVNKNPSWKFYINQRKKYYADKKRNRAKIREFHDEQKTKLRERQKEETKKFYEQCIGKRKKEITQERSMLAVKHKIEKLALRDVQKEAREKYNTENPPFPTYEQWLLRSNKFYEAEEWRHRRDKEPTIKPEIIGYDENTKALFHDIRGFKYVKSKNGLLFMNKQNQGIISFVAYGRTINMYKTDDSSTLAALQLASQKWRALQINGSEEYKKRCAELAVAHGIKINNPELQGYINKLYAEKRTNTKEVYTLANELKHFQEYHDAVGADRYKVTATELFENPKTGNIEKRGFMVNNRDGAPDGFTSEELEKKMQRLLELKKYGRNIYYTPISEKKHHILVDDLDNEAMAKFIMDGYRPAAIIQSSPGNWQAIITIPKLGTDNDKEIGNAIVAKLNKEYGDPNVSGEIHAHRAPGFDNKKPKYRREDGTFPEVKLSRTERVYCEKTMKLAEEIRNELVRQREKESAKMEEMLKRLKNTGKAAINDTNAAYIAHFQDIMRLQDKLGNPNAVIDASRVDAMIGIRLRATGHTKEQIRDTMEVMAPEIRKELGSAGTHPWPEYSARTANYVFGYSGDKALKDKERWISNWKKVEKAATVDKSTERPWQSQPLPGKYTSKSGGMEM
jgi:hypothetical protein